MFVCIHCVVFVATLERVSGVGAAGFMKSVSRETWRIMPGGNWFVAMAVLMMCLWCMACNSLK